MDRSAVAADSPAIRLQVPLGLPELSFAFENGITGVVRKK